MKLIIIAVLLIAAFWIGISAGHVMNRRVDQNAAAAVRTVDQ